MKNPRQEGFLTPQTPSGMTECQDANQCPDEKGPVTPDRLSGGVVGLGVGRLGEGTGSSRWRRRSWGDVFGKIVEVGADDLHPVAFAIAAAEFVGRGGDGFQERVCNPRDSCGVFGGDAATGDSGEDTGKGDGES